MRALRWGKWGNNGCSGLGCRSDRVPDALVHRIAIARLNEQEARVLGTSCGRFGVGQLAVALGGFLVVGSLAHLARMVRHPDSPSRWRALESMARALDAVGADYRFITRGYYVIHAFLATLGAALIIIGGHELGWFPHPSVSWVGLALLFAAFIVVGVGAVVARTGRPSRWIPPPYREDRSEW